VGRKEGRDNDMYHDIMANEVIIFVFVSREG